HQDQRQQSRKLRPVLREQGLGARPVQKVDQPADRPVQRGIDRSSEPADEEKKKERPLRLPGEIEDELPCGGRQHFAVGIVERVDRALEPAPQSFTEVSLAHSAAMPSPAEGSAAASSSRKPPDWRLQSCA